MPKKSSSAKSINSREVANVASVDVNWEEYLYLDDLRQLHEVTLRVARTRDWEAALELILTSTLRAMKTDKGLLALRTKDGLGLEVAISRGLSAEFLRMVQHVPLGKGVCSTALKEKARVWVEDAENDPIFADCRESIKAGQFQSCHSVPLRAHDGSINGVLTVHFTDKRASSHREILLMDLYAQMANDFIERIQAERRERDAEINRQQLMQALATAVYTCDAEGRITSFNEAAAKLWGRRPVLGQEYWCGSHKIYQVDGSPMPMDQCPMAITVREGRSVRGVEILIERPDGSRVHVLPHPDPILDSSGKVTGAVNTLIDLTQLKQKDKELHLRQKQLQAIVDNTPECVKLVASDGTLLDMNKAGLGLIEAESAESVIGQDVFKLIAPEHQSAFRSMHERVCSGNREYLQFEIVGLKGTRRWMETFATPLDDPITGKPLQLAITRDITQRKKSEAATRHLASIVESSEDAIASKDLRGIITSWNKGAEHLFGYTAAEAIGRSVTMLIPQDRINEEPLILERISRGERIEHYETIRQRKDGTLINISLTISPIRDEQGRIVGASKIARDITSRKRAESDLHRRTRVLEIFNQTGAVLGAELNLEKLLQTITDAATEASGAKFGAFFYASLNEQGERFMLYTLSGAPREAFEKFGHPRATPLFGPTFHGEGIIRSGDITKDPRYGKVAPHHGMPKGHLPVRSYLAVPVISRSGEVLGGLFLGHPEVDVFTEEAENVVSGIAGQAAVALDNAKLYQALQLELAEHKKAEEALRQSESQFRLLAESLPQIVWTSRPDGQVDYFNSRWYEFTGLQAGSGDESWTPILHPDDVQKTIDRWYQSVRTGEPYAIEYRFKDQKSGAYRWHLGRALPVRNEAGEIIRWLGTCTDIDDQKRAAENLERAVAERTESLRKAIAQMEEFSYSVSHDLRAPLRAIEGYSKVISEDFGPKLVPEVHELLRRIERNVRRMQCLINDVLTLSRVARTEVTLERVSLRELIMDLIEQNPKLQAPNAQLDLGELSDVLAHEVLLSQAISNLLNNAVKFVEPGKVPLVRVWTEQKDGQVLLWVQDNGIGIPLEYQGKLFGMFQRLHQNPQYDGTGIGLAIVRKAVERMGGSVGVESNGKDGSKFWVQLPAIEA